MPAPLAPSSATIEPLGHGEAHATAGRGSRRRRSTSTFSNSSTRLSSTTEGRYAASSVGGSSPEEGKAEHERARHDRPRSSSAPSPPPSWRSARSRMEPRPLAPSILAEPPARLERDREAPAAPPARHPRSPPAAAAAARRRPACRAMRSCSAAPTRRQSGDEPAAAAPQRLALGQLVLDVRAAAQVHLHPRGPHAQATARRRAR